MFERMKPVLKTYKCEFGYCLIFGSCKGANGVRGTKLVETKKIKNGLIIDREEYYECLNFRNRANHLCQIDDIGVKK